MGDAYLAEIKGRNSPNLGHNTLYVLSFLEEKNEKWFSMVTLLRLIVLPCIVHNVRGSRPEKMSLQWPPSCCIDGILCVRVSVQWEGGNKFKQKQCVNHEGAQRHKRSFARIKCVN